MRRKNAPAAVEKILLRVAIYIRVSTDKQVKDGDSMRDQLATCQKYIDSHENMILVDTYIDDGISGQKLKRDDFQRLLDDVRAGRIRPRDLHAPRSLVQKPPALSEHAGHP